MLRLCTSDKVPTVTRVNFEKKSFCDIIIAFVSISEQHCAIFFFFERGEAESICTNSAEPPLVARGSTCASPAMSPL